MLTLYQRAVGMIKRPHPGFPAALGHRDNPSPVPGSEGPISSTYVHRIGSEAGAKMVAS